MTGIGAERATCRLLWGPHWRGNGGGGTGQVASHCQIEAHYIMERSSATSLDSGSRANVFYSFLDFRVTFKSFTFKSPEKRHPGFETHFLWDIRLVCMSFAKSGFTINFKEMSRASSSKKPGLHTYEKVSYPVRQQSLSFSRNHVYCRICKRLPFIMSKTKKTSLIKTTLSSMNITFFFELNNREYTFICGADQWRAH